MSLIFLLWIQVSDQISKYKYNKYCVSVYEEWKITSEQDARRLEAFKDQFLTPQQKEDKLILKCLKGLIDCL